MSVQDVSRLLEVSHSIVQPNPLVGTPTVDGARYLDALKKSVAPRPKIKPAPASRKRDARPDANPPTRRKPEVERDARPGTDADVKARESNGRDAEPRKVDRKDNPTPTNATHSTEKPATPGRDSRTEPSDAGLSQAPADAISGDHAAPPPAHLLELFSAIAGDDASPVVATATGDPNAEPVPPAGLAEFVTDAFTAGQQAGASTSGDTPIDIAVDENTEAGESADAFTTNVVDVVSASADDQAAAGSVINASQQSVVSSNPVDADRIAIAEEHLEAESAQKSSLETGASRAAENITPLATAAGSTEPHSENTVGATGHSAAQSSGVHPTASAGTAAPTPAATNTVDAGPVTANAATSTAAPKDATVTNANGAAKDNAATQRGEFAQRVMNAVRGAVGGNRSFRVVLQPPELGVLQVEIATDANGKMTARLDVQTQAAHQALSDNLTDLRSALTRQGITLDRIEIQLTEPSQGEDRGLGDQSSNQQDEPRERARDRNEPPPDEGTETEEPEPLVTASSMGRHDELIDLQV